jgi:hypothetical protein
VGHLNIFKKKVEILYLGCRCPWNHSTQCVLSNGSHTFDIEIIKKGEIGGRNSAGRISCAPGRHGRMWRESRMRKLCCMQCTQTEEVQGGWKVCTSHKNEKVERHYGAWVLAMARFDSSVVIVPILVCAWSALRVGQSGICVYVLVVYQMG